MAAAKRLSEQLSDITECSMCTKTFTDPKILPCVHTFCLKCLLKYGEHDKPGDQAACPLCRANFVIPPGGFADLPNNFFVNKLLLVNQLTGGNEKSKCDVCIEVGISANASSFCVECDQNFCDKCSGFHKIMKATKSHQVVNQTTKRAGSSEALLRMQEVELYKLKQ